MWNAWCVFLTVAVRLAFSQALELRTDKTEIQPGERLSLTISLPVPDSDQKAQFSDPPELDDRLLESTHWKVLTRQHLKENGRLKWNFELTHYEPGVQSFPPLSIRVGPVTYSSERALFTISSTRNAEDNELRDGFGEIQIPIHWKRGFLLGLAGAAAVSLLVMASRLLRQKQQVAPDEKISPEEWIRKEVKRLKSECASSNTHPCVDDITGVILEYCARVGSTRTVCWTSRELFRRLARYPEIQGLKGVVSKCDDFRYKPVKANERALVSDSLNELDRKFIHL
jgi:hypothetical protein